MKLQGKVMEPRIMAAWHLRKCLDYATFEELSKLTKINRSTLVSIRYGACDSVPHGTTKRFRDLVEKLRPRGPIEKDDDICVSDPNVRIEIEKLRRTDSRVAKIRKEMAQRAAKGE